MNNCNLLFTALRLWLLGWALDCSTHILDNCAEKRLHQKKPLTGKFFTRYAAFCEMLSQKWKRLETKFLLLQFARL